MSPFVVISGSLFAIFSSMILAYVSMVTSIGPWIAPTLVLIASLVLKTRRARKEQNVEDQEVALAQTTGSVGALVAVAIGFTLPTLYFLDPTLFNSWLASPMYFATIIGAATLSAGGLGMFLAKLFGEKLVYRDKLKFPVSLLIHRMITSQSQTKQVYRMLAGFTSTGIFCFIRDGLFTIRGMLPKVGYLLPSLFGRQFAIAFFNGPTLWAVGFTTGAVIATPLLTGIFSKYLVLAPINNHSLYLPFKLFDVQNTQQFTLAFCSGLVLAEAIGAVRKYPKMVWNILKNNFDIEKIKDFLAKVFFRGTHSGLMEEPIPVQKPENKILKRLRDNAKLVIEASVVVLGAIAFLTYLEFPVLAQLFMLTLTVMATYQISIMGATMGLIPFGRFATFVMIPTMLLFKLNFVQITFLCVFVNICSAVASDLLFDYKVGELCNIKFKQVRKYQWLGLVVTACAMGLLLWLLFTNFQLGSPELFGQRGKARALLIQSTGFNYWVLLIGGLYGLFLKRFKLSPSLTLGGILMPNNISIGLVMGGLLSKVFKQPEDHFPFWSGVFASESIWILSNMLLKLGGF